MTLNTEPANPNEVPRSTLAEPTPARLKNVNQKHIGSYLLYQVARFGALSSRQMKRICDGRWGNTCLYHTLDRLVRADLLYPVIDPRTYVRAFAVTQNGWESVFGDTVVKTTGLRPKELAHTLLCTDLLLDLCQRENVTGLATQFEVAASDMASFCHHRIPDGIFQLTQNGKRYEMALEVECTVRNTGRINDVLDHYWKTLQLRMKCSGVLIVAKTPTIYGMYQRALKKKPPEFQSRVRLIQGTDLSLLPSGAYGQPVKHTHCCVDLARIAIFDEVQYSQVKSSILLSQPLLYTPEIAGAGQ